MNLFCSSFTWEKMLNCQFLACTFHLVEALKNVLNYTKFNMKHRAIIDLGADDVEVPASVHVHGHSLPQGIRLRTMLNERHAAIYLSSNLLFLPLFPFPRVQLHKAIATLLQHSIKFYQNPKCKISLVLFSFPRTKRIK